MDICTSDGRRVSGYLALPESRASGAPGVLVLHAWWGLNATFRDVCDRLARAGYVAFAPDLYGGAIATTIPEAERLVQLLAQEQAVATITTAARALRGHPAVTGDGLGMVGFSLGASYALAMSAELEEPVSAVVAFYGSNSAAGYFGSQAAYLGHFAARDEYEPEEEVEATRVAIQRAGREVTFHVYPGTGHWFFEPDRPDAYNAEAAALAWERTLAFLAARVRGGTQGEEHAT